MARRRYVGTVDIPEEVQDLTRRHLAEADARAAGLIVGLYLTGSVALGDFRPQWSDIDFVGVLERVPTNDDLAALADVHAGLTPQRPYDGVYLSQSTLGHPAAAGQQQPPPTYARTHDGVFSIDQPGSELEPVPWLELGRYGIAVRGATPMSAGLPDPERLRTWLLENLAGYWTALTEQVHAGIQDRTGDAPTFGESVAWIVLGPARLHFTLATGDVTTKSGAADYIARHFPPWAELAERCRRHRRGEEVSFITADLIEAVRLMKQVRADAESRWT